MFYQKLGKGVVQCELCPKRCVIHLGEKGSCLNRQNKQGTLYSQVYNRPSLVSSDPVEKLPFSHYRPGVWCYNVGTVGCNLRCEYCHNWRLSQGDIDIVKEYHYLSPVDVVKNALKNNIKILAFTGNEPTVFYEYLYEISREAKSQNLEVLLNTNGFINPEPMKELITFLDGVNIDLKGFSNKFYRDVVKGQLEPVLDTAKIVREQGAWLELVNLVVPTLNDNPRMIRTMCRWIYQNLGYDIPLHFSRFVPVYKLTHLSPTPLNVLEEARSIAKEEGLNYVTIGNVAGHLYNSTFCHRCGNVLVNRFHFSIQELNITDEGRCRFCHTLIPGKWY